MTKAKLQQQWTNEIEGKHIEEHLRDAQLE